MQTSAHWNPWCKFQILHKNSVAEIQIFTSEKYLWDIIDTCSNMQFSEDVGKQLL